ncbi:MAG TPA: DNA translocase FtsK [Spirochaetota bacterium]|nr:DNA translocase FtsK [Spirochaetota bacterium]
MRRNSELLVNTLRDFGIESRVVNVNRGPVITLYEMQIAPGIKVNRIVGLSDDIAMALAASRVRIVAPIPGKSAIGVEVPNLEREMVTLGDIIKTPEYRITPGRLKVALGEDILGKPVMLDIKKLPHLLIAGATGSGKSVCVNSIITSLVYNYSPNYVRFIMVDPKMVELQLYNGLPHMLTPVITEPHVAPKALKWAMFEMERRYRLLSELNTRDIDRYNEKIEKQNGQYERLPYIVIIMDELADLMMVAAKEIEGFITRIAQKARAVGIHLVLATQRPSVDVITGIIKANFPARIAFQVAQKTDSRTIIDQNGAEKLLGKGDMLYQSPMSSFPVRIQGAFISEDEVIDIVRHLRKMGRPSYIDIEENIFDDEDFDGSDDENGDELFTEALKIVEETKKASASYLQRRLSIGYNRAARMIELMEDKGLIGPQQGSKPRDVYL